MLFGSGINAAEQRQNKFEIKHSHLITNVEVNNIKLSGCAGFTQLQRKLLQCSSHYYLVENDKAGLFLFSPFCMEITNLFAWDRLHFKSFGDFFL